jgi:hypothetical protein
MPHPAGYRLRWIDKGLLFTCCLGVFLAWFLSAGTFAPEAVPAMLAAIIVSGLLSLAETEKYRIGLTTGYALVCCFVPTLTFFLPLMAYDMPGGEKSFGDSLMVADPAVAASVVAASVVAVPVGAAPVVPCNGSIWWP